MASIAVAACVSAAALAPSAHAAGATLTPTGKAKFPARSFVLTLPGGATPSPGAIRVRENGRDVSDLSVSPARGRFGVVLVIDTSGSMRGRPIHGAMAAARAFAGQRPPSQSLGVVMFNERSRVVVEPTKDSATIDAALSRTPVLAPGTHIYDATSAALRQLEQSGFDAGAVVVLSDGADSGSAATADQVAHAARSVHARVFSVGLRSRSFDPETLQRVAAGGAGEYLGAASADGLAGVYRQLGGQLANAYFVRYRSLARSGAKVRTEVDAAGHRTVADYRAPKLALAPVALGEERAPLEHDSFLASATGTTVIAIAVLVLAFVSVLTLASHFRRKAELRGRISAYGLPLPDEPDLPGSHDEVTRDGMSERWAFGGKRWAALGASLELARIGITPPRFVALVALATLVLAWVATLLAGSAFAAILMLGLTPFMARTYVGWKLGKERRAFGDQLADSMQAVASAMRTGNSFVGAIAILVEDAPEPTATEFRRVIADERLGVPLEEAFGRVVQRMDNRDLEQVALVSILQRETGGNGAEALDRVVGNLRARADIRRLLRTLTSQGRMAQWVLTALPVVTVVLMTLLGGEQMQLLYTTVIGQVALVVAALLVIGGGGWIRKIVNIRV